MSGSKLSLSTNRLEFKSWMPNSQSFSIGNTERQTICIVSTELPAGFSYFDVIREDDLNGPLCHVIVKYDPYENGTLRAVSQEDYEATFLMLIGAMGPLDEFKIQLAFEQEAPKKSALLECGVCRFDYDEDTRTPKVLSCGHTFCESCLKNLEEKHLVSVVQCPTDRITTYGPLPINRAIVDMIRERKEKEDKDKLKLVDDPIVPCRENEKHESTVYCQTCGKSFCDECFAESHKPRSFSDHTKIPVSEKPMILPKCSMHPDRLADVICKKCDSKPFCNACFKHRHQKHAHEKIEKLLTANLKKLEDSFNDMESREETLTMVIDRTEKAFGSEEIDVLKRKITREYTRRAKQTIEKLDTFVEKQKETSITNGQIMTTYLEKFLEDKKNTEKRLKRKADLLDVDEIIKRNDSEWDIFQKDILSMGEPVKFDFSEHISMRFSIFPLRPNDGLIPDLPASSSSSSNSTS